MKLRLALVLLLLPALSSTKSIFDRKQFQSENLINLNNLGLPASSGIISSWGDFNSDNLLDLFQLSLDQSELSTFIWNRKEFKFIENLQSKIIVEPNLIIQNVLPGDFNLDGKLDLLLMTRTGTSVHDQELTMWVYLQSTDGTFAEPYKLDSSILAQPIPFDATGTMKPDLLGFAYSTSATSLVPSIWQNVWETSSHTKVFELSPPPFMDLTNFNCTFPHPHSNAYIDLDGDCLADLFLMCQGKRSDEMSYQIWINDKVLGYRLSRIGDLPKGTKSVGFADIDRDGTIDLIITSCPTLKDCHLSIAYNTQIPLCTSSSIVKQVGPCRDPDELCRADPEFKFDLNPIEENHAFTSIPLSSLIPSASTLTTSSTSFSGILPTPPQIGDFNKDGYPDLLLQTTHSGAFNSIKKVTLLESRPCEKGACTDLEIKFGRRAFRIVVEGAEVLNEVEDVESCSWIDIDDDGTLDILIQRTGNGTTAGGRDIMFIKNNYFHDAFFLKALVLNGACQAWCEPTQPGESRYRPYGVSYSGASYKFTVLDSTGARKATAVGQLPQTAYMSLGTPYSYFGLGRTNNYVENLFIGSTFHQELHFINIEGVIPNSQVIIDPFQPSLGTGEGEGNPGSWSKELYLHPGDWIPWVTVVLGAAIILMAGVVFALHLNEKKQDEMERRSTLNFHAL